MFASGPPPSTSSSTRGGAAALSAISIPLDQLAERLAELPTDVDVVAYCRDAYCVLTHDAVRLLTARGHRATSRANLPRHHARGGPAKVDIWTDPAAAW